MKPIASRGLARVLVVAAVTVLVAWYSFATSMGQVFQSRRPELALRFDPGNSVALSSLAFERLSALRNEKGLPAAREPALSALLSAPGDARAIFVAGVTADGGRSTPQAIRRAQLSLKFSRRNPAAYLWLIEERTAAGDVDKALDYYDLAMRSSPEARGILVPIMIAAMDDPALGRPITNVLARGANWTITFWEKVVQADPFPSSVGATLVRLSGSKGLPPKGIGDYVIQRLVDNLRFDEAATVAARYYPAFNADHSLGALGRFVSPEIPSPFAWQLISNADVSASAVKPDRLAMSMFSSNGGVYARKLLQLPPGSYLLGATLASQSGMAGGSPRIRLRCGNDNVMLADVVADQAPSGDGKFLAHFSVPAACRAEWLEIASPTSDANGGNWELFGLRVQRVGAQ